jgi:exopolysaccharide production protein ExoQ
MSPTAAIVVFVVGIIALFILDHDRHARTSPALWISVAWFSIVCSRPITLWVEPGMWIGSASYVVDGSPLDRLVFTCLLLAGTVVIVSRRTKVVSLLTKNKVIVLFFCYAVLSLLWSDYPGVAFKRWIEALGDVAMVLIVLSDHEPLAAVKRLLARLAFILIPVSVLFTKYFPNIGMAYNEWTGTPVYTGVTTNKNSLGAICLCFGLGTLWRVLSDCRDLRGPQRMKRLIANLVILVMVLRLFQLMNSMTSLCSFVMASTLLLAGHVNIVRRKKWIVHGLMASMLIASVSVLFLGISPDALQALGRNPTLTERTLLWGQLLAMVREPILGTGFESFWLGPRLTAIWQLNPWLPNEAHNGYLEVFLNLGWVGVGLLAVAIMTTYRSVLAAWRRNEATGNLRLAYLFVGLVFNCTEAAFFRMQATVWLFFLLASVSAPAGAFRKNRGITQSSLQSAHSPGAEKFQSAIRSSWPELPFPTTNELFRI